MNANVIYSIGFISSANDLLTHSKKKDLLNPPRGRWQTGKTECSIVLHYPPNPSEAR